MERRKFTKEEDNIIIAAVKKNPQNIAKVFRELSVTLHRSTDSLRVRYYKYLAKDPENKLFFLLSPNKRYRNYKVQRKEMKDKPERSTKSKWQRIIAILFE